MELDFDLPGFSEQDVQVQAQASENEAEGNEENQGQEGSNQKGRKRTQADAETSSVLSRVGSKASAAAKVGGVRKQSKTHSRKCKACLLWFRPEHMGNKAPYCGKDKNRIDNLTRMAKQLGKTKWFNEIKSDEQKLNKVLLVYKELTGDDGDGAKKKARSAVLLILAVADHVVHCVSIVHDVILQVPKGILFMTLEKKVAGSRVSHDAELRLMPEDAYLRHATETLTEQEGRLTGSQAAAQWILGKPLCKLCVRVLAVIRSRTPGYVKQMHKEQQLILA